MTVKMIALSGDAKSQYYSSICIPRWQEFGVEVELFEGTTPDTLGDALDFADEKFSGRPFTEVEKAIWYSHYRVWESVTGPTYVIEHDTYPHKPLPKFDTHMGFFSTFPRNDDAWLKRKETVSPGSGYYINVTSASVLIEYARAMKIKENVDGHLHTTCKQLLGLKEAEFQEYHLKNATAFQIVNYEVGTSGVHNE